MKEDILEVDMKELHDRAKEYLDVMCGYHRNTTRAKKSEELALAVERRIFEGERVKFLIAEFGPEHVKEDHFEFDDIKIPCKALTKMDPNSIYEGYIYFICAPMPNMQKYDVSDMYLADCWETCFVDAGRDYIRRKLLQMANEKRSEDLYITDPLAPGMAGMPCKSLRDFFQITDPEKIGISLLPSGMMNPLKSFTGIHLVMDQKNVIATMNCSECVSGHKFCEYCQNYAKRYMGNACR